MMDRWKSRASMEMSLVDVILSLLDFDTIDKQRVVAVCNSRLGLRLCATYTEYFCFLDFSLAEFSISCLLTYVSSMCEFQFLVVFLVSHSRLVRSNFRLTDPVHVKIPMHAQVLNLGLRLLR